MKFEIDNNELVITDGENIYRLPLEGVMRFLLDEPKVMDYFNSVPLVIDNVSPGSLASCFARIYKERKYDER